MHAVIDRAGDAMGGSDRVATIVSAHWAFSSNGVCLEKHSLFSSF
jgi:hypothetical protein